MSKRRILVIDDEEDFCFFVRANLEVRGGCEVRTSSRAEDGLRLARSFKPDLIVLDIIMPETDGFAALRELKQNPKTQHIPVLMLSARRDDASKIEAAGLYAEGYLTKPVLIDDLRAKVDRILALRCVD